MKRINTITTGLTAIEATVDREKEEEIRRTHIGDDVEFAPNSYLALWDDDGGNVGIERDEL